MLPFDDFKKSLGQAAQDLSNEEIEALLKLEDQLADTFFDIWLEKKNKKFNQNAVS